MVKHKIYSPEWSFNKRVEISSAVERIVLLGGFKLGKNETNDAETLIIHDTRRNNVLIFSSRPPFMQLNISLSCLKCTASIFHYTNKYKASTCS